MSTTGNYPLRPSKLQRRVLAVLTAARIAGEDSLLFEDIRARLPHDERGARRTMNSLLSLETAGYVAQTVIAPENGVGYYQSWAATPKGMRVTLGVLG